MTTNLLDERIDEIASTGRQARPARLAMAVLISGFLLFNLGIAIALGWFAAALVAEAYGLSVTILTRRFDLSPTMRRLAYVSAVVVMVSAWTALTIVLWMSREPALQWAAICLAAGQLIHAQAVTFRAPLLFAIDSGLPALSLVTMPVIVGRYSPVQTATMMVAVALVLIYTLASASMNSRRMRDLEAAEEKALRASEAKSAFLAMMSHEIRTPMNGVLAMADALAATQLDATQSRHAAVLKRSGEDLMAMLNDVLDISRIEAGKLDLELRPFAPGELLSDIQALWKPAAAAKGLRLDLEMAPSLAGHRTGDPTRLRQIIGNLVSNAVKFTQTGRLLLRASPGATGDDVVFEVVDTGIGMTPEQQARLFQSFSQADASIVRRFGGSGLGLSICSQLAELMDGAITVESVAGSGSKFRLSLPLPLSGLPEEAATSVTNLVGLNVLVADDNRVNQMIARAVLEAAGAHVNVADDGAEALEHLRTSA